MSKNQITVRGQVYSFDWSRFGGGNDDRVFTYAVALERALRDDGHYVSSHYAETGTAYLTITADDDEASEFVVRVGDHDARGTCDANLILGVDYQDSDIETINTRGRGSRAIEMVARRVTRWAKERETK